MSRNWGKKYEEVSKKISKKGKLAAEGHHLKQQADKKLATESLEETMIRTGVENFETGEVIDYKIAYADDNVWGFMNKSFYNKLITDTKSNTQKEVEEEMMEQFKVMLNEVLDVRESNKRQEEIQLAELRIKELELQIRLAELNRTAISAPVEFELAPFIPTTHGKLEEVMEEHAAAVQMITEVLEVTEKPAKKTRRAKLRNKVEEVVISDGPSTPIRYLDGRCTIAWKKVIKADRFDETMIAVLNFAIELGVDITKANQFKKFSPFFNGAYQQFGRIYVGRGMWVEFIQRHIQ